MIKKLKAKLRWLYHLLRIEPIKVVLCVGDSLTYGTGAGKKQSYPARLSEMTDAYIINAGICGDTSVGVLRRIGTLMKKHRPDQVVLCIGTNDLALNVSEADIKKTISGICRMVKQYTPDILLIAVMNNGVDLPLYAEIAKEQGVDIMPNVLGALLSFDGLRSDAVHGNDAAYYVLARYVSGYV